MDLGSKQSSWLFAHNKFKAGVFPPVCFIAVLIFYQLSISFLITFGTICKYSNHSCFPSSCH